MSIQSRSEQILQDTIDGVLTNVKDKSRIEHLLVQLNELIVSGGGSSDYAVDLSMTINSSTFVITAQLINKDGDPIGTPQTIDLPMESVVVGASYDSTNKTIILTLQNGNTTSVPIGDIIYGLQPLIDAQHKLDADLVDDTNSTNKFVSDSDKTTWNAKQDAINSSHKLSADLVDDTNSTNKFVTEADKTTWNGKQDALTFDNVPTSESTNPVTSGGVYTALGDKQDVVSDLATIRSNASAGAGAATVVQGIDETGNNYIELKSGQREYLSTTVPTGNIPTGSVGMGFDEGIWTYKSGTKVSEGVEIADSSDPHYQDKKFLFYANGQPLADYTIYGNDGGVGDRTVNLCPMIFSHTGVVDDNGGTGSYTTRLWSDKIPVSASQSYYATIDGRASNDEELSFNRIIQYDENEVFISRIDAVNLTSTSFTTSANCRYVVLDIRTRTLTVDISASDINTLMLNEGSTALPYEPYGYKIPVICGGQTTNIYIDSPLGANDSIDYTTSQVTIPTVDGANNLICDTTVQPSKISLTYTGWHSDLDDTTARIEALENAPVPSGGMTYDTLYEGTTISSYPYPLSHPITGYKFIIVAVGYSGVYTNTIVPVAVWSAITGGGNNYDVTIDTAQLRINASEISPRSANNRIVYGVYGVK